MGRLSGAPQPPAATVSGQMNDQVLKTCWLNECLRGNRLCLDFLQPVPSLQTVSKPDQSCLSQANSPRPRGPSLATAVTGQALGPDEHGPLTSAGLAQTDGKPGLLCRVHTGMVAHLPDGSETEVPPSPRAMRGQEPHCPPGRWDRRGKQKPNCGFFHSPSPRLRGAQPWVPSPAT